FEQGFDLRLWPERLDLPLRWRKSRRIFVNSMSDLFHAGVRDDFVRRVFATMVQADWHVYQILTKRPQRLVRLAPSPPRCPGVRTSGPRFRGSRTSPPGGPTSFVASPPPSGSSARNRCSGRWISST